jgi:bifunctional non-homologous end joining protein LigD
MIYAFDLIEHDGVRSVQPPVPRTQTALAPLLRDCEPVILLNDHIAEDGPNVFAHAYRLRAEGIVSKKIDGTYQSGRAASGSRSAIPPASPCRGSGAGLGTGVL